MNTNRLSPDALRALQNDIGRVLKTYGVTGGMIVGNRDDWYKHGRLMDPIIIAGHPTIEAEMRKWIKGPWPPPA